MINAKTPRCSNEQWGFYNKIPGGYLVSHTVTHKVTLRLPGLTDLFGMGTGSAFFLTRPFYSGWWLNYCFDQGYSNGIINI
jgi:hypothetical protein